MSEVIIIDGLQYTASNHRLRYNPEFHENHGKQFTEEDLAYMCSMWDSRGKADIAMALGRTHGTVLSKAYQLRKTGRFDYYRALEKSI
jgi:hypothetical protein